MREPTITVSPVQETEFVQCLDIAREAFGFRDIDLVPAWQMLTVARHGGLVLGARARGSLIGYCYAFPGFHADRSYLYSSGLQVRRAHWSQGVGRALKLAEREHAKRLGYDTIIWTVDALASSPLHLYLNRLGARATGFQPHPFFEVLAEATADELEVTWSIEAAAAESRSRPVAEAAVSVVEIPWDVRHLAAEQPAETARWRAGAGKAMKDLLESGLAGTGVAVDREQQRSYVLFSHGTPTGDVQSWQLVYQHRPQLSARQHGHAHR